MIGFQTANYNHPKSCKVADESNSTSVQCTQKPVWFVQYKTSVHFIYQCKCCIITLAWFLYFPCLSVPDIIITLYLVLFPPQERDTILFSPRCTLTDNITDWYISIYLVISILSSRICINCVNCTNCIVLTLKGTRYSNK